MCNKLESLGIVALLHQLQAAAVRPSRRETICSAWPVGRRSGRTRV